MQSATAQRSPGISGCRASVAGPFYVLSAENDDVGPCRAALWHFPFGTQKPFGAQAPLLGQRQGLCTCVMHIALLLSALRKIYPYDSPMTVLCVRAMQKRFLLADLVHTLGGSVPDLRITLQYLFYRSWYTVFLILGV